jgi:hypothetical protein
MQVATDLKLTGDYSMSGTGIHCWMPLLRDSDKRIVTLFIMFSFLAQSNCNAEHVERGENPGFFLNGS